MHNNRKTNSRTAGAPAEEHQTETNNIAILWLALRKRQDDQKALNHFGQMVDTLLRKVVPKKSLTGIMAGREGDVRQEAYLMLEGLLNRNEKLHEARRSGDMQEIGGQVKASIIASSYIAKMRLTRAVSREAAALERYAGQLEPQSEIQPSIVLGTSEMDMETRKNLVRAAIKDAVEKQLLDETDAGILGEILGSGIPQAEVARRKNLSRGRVCQRTRRAVDTLREIIANTEVPL